MVTTAKILTLALANEIIVATCREARAQSLKPLAVCVLDSGGHLISLQREEEASIMRPEIALGKARGALAMGLPSRTIETMAIERPYFVNALSSLLPGGLVPVAGGVLICDEENHILGAVGVSGDSSDNDEHCACVGVRSAGFGVVD